MGGLTFWKNYRIDWLNKTKRRSTWFSELNTMTIVYTFHGPRNITFIHILFYLPCPNTLISDIFSVFLHEGDRFNTYSCSKTVNFANMSISAGGIHYVGVPTEVKTKLQVTWVHSLFRDHPATFTDDWSVWISFSLIHLVSCLEENICSTNKLLPPELLVALLTSKVVLSLFYQRLLLNDSEWSFSSTCFLNRRGSYLRLKYIMDVRLFRSSFFAYSIGKCCSSSSSGADTEENVF